MTKRRVLTRDPDRYVHVSVLITPADREYLLDLVEQRQAQAGSEAIYEFACAGAWLARQPVWTVIRGIIPRTIRGDSE
jgi:hypothetical protein